MFLFVGSLFIWRFASFDEFQIVALLIMRFNPHKNVPVPELYTHLITVVIGIVEVQLKMSFRTFCILFMQCKFHTSVFPGHWKENLKVWNEDMSQHWPSELSGSSVEAAVKSVVPSHQSQSSNCFSKTC